MKIGIYDPYLNTMGGGEWYVLSIASCLASENDVTIFWDDPKILESATKRFGIDFSNIAVFKNIFSNTPFLKKMQVTKQYDLILFVSDGSIPLLFGKKNILLFQFPVNWIHKGLINSLKLARINEILCYSDYVKEFLDKTFHKNSIVLAPSIAVTKKKISKKENIILSVGRFTKAMNAKKQDVLIQAFKELVDKGLKNWKLVLIGGMLPEDEDFVEKLKSLAKGYPIDILPNIIFHTLQEAYGKAKVYWHAAGFGENLEKNPEKAEHFGITTVEAMSSGVVPIVINAGGQKEIVTNGENGFLWNTIPELQEQTLRILKDQKLWEQLSQNAQNRAKDFSQEKFCQKVKQLFVL